MAQTHGGVNPEVTAAVAGAVDGHSCLVALGGGADSAVLLAAASEVDAPSLRAVFVDHHLDSTRALIGAAKAGGCTVLVESIPKSDEMVPLRAGSFLAGGSRAMKSSRSSAQRRSAACSSSALIRAARAPPEGAGLPARTMSKA